MEDEDMTMIAVEAVIKSTKMNTEHKLVAISHLLLNEGYVDMAKEQL